MTFQTNPLIPQLVSDKDLYPLFLKFFMRQTGFAMSVDSGNDFAISNSKVRFLNSLSALVIELDKRMDHEETLDVVEELLIPHVLKSVNPRSIAK